MQRTQRVRCYPDNAQSSAPDLPILAFYMDHSLLVFTAEILRNLMALNEPEVFSEVATVCQTIFDTANRLLDLVIDDPIMRRLRLGWHNNLLIMITQAISEMLHVSNHRTVRCSVRSVAITQWPQQEYDVKSIRINKMPTGCLE